MNYGRYQVIKELGRGTMGVVYQAHDPQIDRLVALKILRQDRVISEDFVQRFLIEARAIGRLSHPNIVTVYDVGRDNETIYIAMEYLEGKPLNEVMKENKLGITEIVRIGAQVAETLDYAHSKAIIHRDIKPSNIILTPDLQVKLTDFGIARIEDPSECLPLTRAGEILGTPLYMPPEQVICQEVDGRSDLYSLGVILYEFTTGRRPFRGGNITAVLKAITQDRPVAPIEVEGSIPNALSELIMISLRKEPNDRFQNGLKMAEALKHCLGTGEADLLMETNRGAKAKHFGILILSTLILMGLSGTFYYHFGTDIFLKQTGRKEAGSSFHDESASSFKENRMSILDVESMPIGAQIFLDNSYKGSTPLKIRLPFGTYEVRLSLGHYYDWEAQIQLDEEGEMPLSVTLLPMIEGKNQE